MKIPYSAVFFLLLPVLWLNSCIKDDCTITKSYIRYDPVYIQPEVFDSPVGYSAARNMENTGIVYAYGDYVLVNEPQKGIHIIDNSVAKNPVTTGFLEIPGNTHFTIRNNALYANMLEDLVVIDVTDMSHPSEINRVREVFYTNAVRVSEKGILVSYEMTDQTLTVDCNDHRYNSSVFQDGSSLYIDHGGFQFADTELSNVYYAAGSAKSGAPASLGVGGSMARFTTIGAHLYLLSANNLETLDISDEFHPVKEGGVSVSFNAETLYPFGDYLFIGTSSGMHIYSVAQQGWPEHVSTMVHIRACDPVITDGRHAYVTLRGGTECGGFVNQLETYNVEDVFQPQLLDVYPMENPHGLTKSGDRLFVCEGEYGWKMIDAGTPGSYNTTYQQKKHHAYDVLITPGHTLLVVGDDGLYQYDITGKNPELISDVKTRKK